MKTTQKDYKEVIKLIFKVMYWISIFLIIPTITNWYLQIKWIEYARDAGIIIVFISLWRIRRGIKKKEKEEKKKESK